MTDIKPTLLRLRTTTVAMLKDAVAQSAHRSMASLADEILSNELSRKQRNDVDKMIASAKKF